MKTRIFNTVLLVTAMTTFLSFDLPNGWFVAGLDPENYEIGLAKNAGYEGKNSASIKSLLENSDGFGTLMQLCSPEKYFGKQIKMTGYIKSENVKGWAGFWLRVDGHEKGEVLSFDNMQDRAVSGTSEWKKYEILLPVPSDAYRIAFGALLSGTGQIWFDDITFEVVDNSDNPAAVEKSDKTTNKDAVTNDPANLNFEE